MGTSKLVARYQTDDQRLPGFDTELSRRVSLRRRGLRRIEIAVNGSVVEQLEVYATGEGVFLAGWGGAVFQHELAPPVDDGYSPAEAHPEG